MILCKIAYLHCEGQAWADSREVRDREEGIRVEDVRLKEPLEQVPRHWASFGMRLPLSLSVLTAF